jgi:Flp pilus assembly protein TadG
MRWLADRFVTPFARRSGDESEEGVVLVLVAVSMVVLLGAVALTVDVGRIYQERRELQNGADAAALAVAHDCASGDCGTSQTTADLYADANATDGSAGVESVSIDSGAKKVTVYTVTDGASGNAFPMTFARVVGFDEVTVRAKATVAWDGLRAGSALPVLFRESLWNDIDPSRLTTVEEAMSGAAPADRLVTIAHRSDRDPADPSSAAFEWLIGSAGCAIDVEVGELVEHRDGMSPDATPPSDCSGAGLGDVVGSIALVSFFDGGDFESGNSKRVSGIGALYVESAAECGDEGFCITGYFIGDHVVDGPLGGGDFGVNAVQFVSE